MSPSGPGWHWPPSTGTSDRRNTFWRQRWKDWQKRLTRRILAARSSTDEGPLPGILDYLQRAQRAFHRNPNMTALMLQAMTSADPEAKAAIDHMNRTNVEMFNRLLEGVAEDDIPNVSFGINGALSNALAGVLAGMSNT